MTRYGALKDQIQSRLINKNLQSKVKKEKNNKPSATNRNKNKMTNLV